MKNYDEMYQSVLSKYDEYLEKKKKRMLALRRTVPVLACLCFVAILGLGHWNKYTKFPDDPIKVDIIETVTKETHDNNIASTTYSTVTTYSDNRAESVTTTFPVSTTKPGKVSTTEKQQTPVVSTVVNETTSNIVTERVMETQAPATTVRVTQTITEVQITEPITTTVVIPIQEIKIGYYDTNYNKPLPSARIALKCKAFCYFDEKLTIDVAKGDGAFHSQDYNSNRFYEYSAFPTVINSPITDEVLIINGEIGSYKKKYAEEEMQAFDINGKYSDYEAYQHEMTEIDFKNFEVGSSGCITFKFVAVFTDDPLNPSTSGMQQNLYFYVGEKGIAISPYGVEEAMEEYDNISSLF